MPDTVKLSIVRANKGREIRSADGTALYLFRSKRKDEAHTYELKRLGAEEIVLATFTTASACIRGADKAYGDVFTSMHSGPPTRFQTVNGEHRWDSAPAIHTQLNLIQTLGRSKGPCIASFHPRKHGFLFRGDQRGYIKLFQPDDFLVDGAPSAFLDDAMIYFYAYLINSTRPPKSKTENKAEQHMAEGAGVGAAPDQNGAGKDGDATPETST